MAIVTATDTEALQEIRYLLDVSMTPEELPDGVITAHAVLVASNRWVLQRCGMTETEFNALDANDPRRETFKEAVIRRCASELIPTVAQLIISNENGLYSRYQRINWTQRKRQLDSRLLAVIADYSIVGGFVEAAISTKQVY